MTHEKQVEAIIKASQALLHEYGEMVDSYEFEDYAEKLELMDVLWFAIDDYRKATGYEQPIKQHKK